MELKFKNENIELIGNEAVLDINRSKEFSPVQMMVAASGACGMYVFSSLLTNSNIKHNFIKTDVSYKTDNTNKVRPLSEISITYHLEVNEEIKERVSRILKLVGKNCPVIQSLSDNVLVIENIIYY